MAQALGCALVGVGRSGTSSLFQWLAAHPAIQGSFPKETYFFMDTDHPLANAAANFNADGWAGFEQFFAEPAYGRIRLEATVHHIYQDTALDAFTGQDELPLVIICLREPAEQIRSGFYFTRNNRATIDKNLDFPRFVDHLLDGSMGNLREHFLTEEAFYILQRILTYNHYLDWVARWAQRLPQRPPELVLFEQISTEPKAVMTRLCERLAIDSGIYATHDFAATNASHQIRSVGLKRAAHRAKVLLPSGRVREIARRMYRRYQTSPPTDAHSRAEQRALARLREYYAPWNRRLTETFGCDLRPWQI